MVIIKAIKARFLELKNEGAGMSRLEHALLVGELAVIAIAFLYI